VKKAQRTLRIKTENSRGKVIPLIEESVQIDEKWVETGKVQISKKVSEHSEMIDIPLKHKEFNT
jgi:stress response protein YsnF